MNLVDSANGETAGASRSNGIGDGSPQGLDLSLKIVDPDVVKALEGIPALREQVPREEHRGWKALTVRRVRVKGEEIVGACILILALSVSTNASSLRRGARGPSGSQTGATVVVTNEGAVPDGVVNFDGSASGSMLSSASFPFHSSDVGKLICVAKVAADGVGQQCGTIASYQNAGQVGLSWSVGRGASSATFEFATDSLKAFNNGCSDVCKAGGGELLAPQGDYMLSGQWVCGADCPITIQGEGQASVGCGFIGGNGYSDCQTVNNTKLGTHIAWATTGLSGAALKIDRQSMGDGVPPNLWHVTIEDLTLYGGVGYAQDGGGNVGVGIYNSPWIVIRNAFIGNFKGDNILLAGGAGGGYLDGVMLDSIWSFLSGGRGLDFTGEVQNVTVQNSQFDNNLKDGILLAASIWSAFYSGNNIQRNNTGNARVETYYQVNATAMQYGSTWEGNYFEDDVAGNPTLVAPQSTNWSYTKWGTMTASNFLVPFMPIFNNSSDYLGTCDQHALYVRQCVSDGALSCPAGGYYSGGNGKTGCYVQCDSASHWAYTGEQCFN